jgi:hypothetical protein
VPLFGAAAYDVANEREGDIPFEEQLRGLEQVVKAGKVRICKYVEHVNVIPALNGPGTAVARPDDKLDKQYCTLDDGELQNRERPSWKCWGDCYT